MSPTFRIFGKICPDPISQQCVSGYCVTKQPVASGGVYAPCVNPDGSGCYNNTKNTKWEDGRVLTLTPYDGSCPDEKAAINGRCWLDLGNPNYRETVGGGKGGSGAGVFRVGVQLRFGSG